MSNFDEKLKKLKQEFPELTSDTVDLLIQQGTDISILDVREKDELNSGMIESAIHIPKSILELQVESELKDKEQEIVLVCGSGLRSLLAAESLMQLGYTNLKSLFGGMQSWKEQGKPTIRPQMLDAESRQRYARHLLIPEIGESGQLKLLNSKVLLVGAGGLGSPCALYLAAAGVGTLGIIDNDVVELSNLQRQIIHGESNLGQKKVKSAASRIADLNASVNVVTYDVMLDESNIDELFAEYDLIVDGCDNFNTRYLINDACVKHKKPNVHGAVYRFDGYVTVFDQRKDGPCYRCLYPSAPPPELAPSCMEAGVMGVLPGVIGMLQAVEAIKTLLDLGSQLNHKLLRYDALESEFFDLSVSRNHECEVCGDNAAPIKYQTQYSQCLA